MGAIIGGLVAAAIGAAVYIYSRKSKKGKAPYLMLSRESSNYIVAISIHCSILFLFIFKTLVEKLLILGILK